MRSASASAARVSAFIVLETRGHSHRQRRETLRINGLYFDQAYALSGRFWTQTSIKVGLSAQGYPFAAPSGIVDQSLRMPSDTAGASIVGNFDSNGTWGRRSTAHCRSRAIWRSATESNATRTGFADGTSNAIHTVSLIARWRPSPAIEITPFWSLTDDFDDEAGTFYLPAGSFLPKLPRPDHNEGPGWSDYRYTGLNTGLLASARISQNWVVRLGAFEIGERHQDQFHQSPGEQLPRRQRRAAALR